MNADTPTPANGLRRMQQLTPAQCLHLLASVEYGRIVFTQAALPAIRPVNHLIDDGQIIVRTRLTATLTTAVTVATDIVVAYEADQLDPAQRLGWSVVATGIARPITDPARIARYEHLLQPWVDMPMHTVIAVHPQIVTGFRLTATT
jgi:nitroimidazol reductase NimA-like FMN-containing flavoprotein (pyridoxamine 5'-phosphate oxidase superfamily)